MLCLKWNKVVSRIRLMQDDRKYLSLFALSGLLWILLVLGLSAALENTVAADRLAFAVEHSEPLQSDVEKGNCGNRLDSAVMARRHLPVRYSSRGDRRYSGSGAAAPRFQTPCALLSEMLTADLLLIAAGAEIADRPSFLIQTCLRASIPVRAGPFAVSGVSASGAMDC